MIGLSDSKKSFVQFRQCKLTHLLKDSIGGNCMTRMIANIWPEARHMEETVNLKKLKKKFLLKIDFYFLHFFCISKVSTLRFSSRMMNVSVEPAVNEIIDPMVLSFCFKL